MRIYNRRRGKQVCLQKVLVDLPTKAAKHFFRPIKNLTPTDRSSLQLMTIAPLLEEGQTAEEFWQTHCGLSDKEVHYHDGCVRQAFKKYRHRQRDDKPFSLSIRFKNGEELELIQKCLKRGSLQTSVQNGEILISLPPEDRMVTVLLGSQPAKEATFNYVKGFLQTIKEDPSLKSPVHLFVFCAEHSPKQKTLFCEVAEYVSEVGEDLSHFTVVPFSFQNEETVASLFHRSDLTCTRSGGQTAMELMCVGSGQICVHSEAKKDPRKNEDPSLQELLKGILGWEAASALYLQKACDAKIVTPETILSCFKEIVSSKVLRAHKKAEKSLPVPR